MRALLTDAQWARLCPLLPPPARTGRPRADDRRTLEAILYVLRTGCAWADLPPALGDDATAHRRLKRWQVEGVWERIRHALLAQLDGAGGIDWSAALLDGSFVPAKRGGAGIGLTGKGKGVRVMLATDAAGVRLGLLTAGANVGEVRLAEATLATIHVPRPRGRLRTRPDQLIADRGYDSRPLRRRLRARGIRPCIPPRRRPATWRPARGRPLSTFDQEYARRWPIERTFAWPGHQRRLLVRHERLPEVHHAFLTIACALVALKSALAREARPSVAAQNPPCPAPPFRPLPRVSVRSSWSHTGVRSESRVRWR